MDQSRQDERCLRRLGPDKLCSHTEKFQAYSARPRPVRERDRKHIRCLIAVKKNEHTASPKKQNARERTIAANTRKQKKKFLSAVRTEAAGSSSALLYTWCDALTRI